MLFVARRALESEHPDVCDVASTSKYTSAFSTHIFYTEGWRSMYLKGEVGVVRGDHVLGFVYSKHLVRHPYSKLHFLAVLPCCGGLGIGSVLLDWALSATPHPVVRLNCEVGNQHALGFYVRRGGRLVGEHTSRGGTRMHTFEFSALGPNRGIFS